LKALPHRALARLKALPAPSASFRIDVRGNPARFSHVIFWTFLAACVTVNYPGRLSADAVGQLIGAYDVAHLNNWHSPLIAWLWSIPGGLIGQPAGALLIQSLPLAFYAAVRSSRPFLMTARDGAALVVELAFKAALIALAGTIIKDVLLGGLVLAAVAALQLSLSGNNRKRWISLGLACLALVAMVRPANFVLLLIPAWAFLYFSGLSRRTFWLAAFGVTLAALLLLPAYGVLTRVAFGPRPVQPEKQLILFDIAAVSASAGQNLFRGIGGWPADGLPEPGTCYTPAMWDPMAPWGRCKGYSIAYDKSYHRAGGSPLVKQWATAIVSHPGAYVNHRARHVVGSLQSGMGRFGERSAWGNNDALIALNSTDKAAELARISAGRLPKGYFAMAEQSILPKPFSRMARIVLGTRGMPLVALIACIGLLGWQLRRHRKGAAIDPVIVFATSLGIANLLLVGVFGVSTSARYLLPLILCSYVAILAALQKAPDRGDEPASGGENKALGEAN
jgi:hypothetical protein